MTPPAGTLIVFDLDGTLVDTAPDLIGALNLVLAEEGLAPRPLCAARALVGRGARFLLAHGFEEAGAHPDGAALDRLVSRFLDIYRERLTQESRPFDRAAETLDALVRGGVVSAVCTNKPGGLARRLLEDLGLSSRFACIVGADDAGCAKPDPRHLLYVLERVGGAHFDRCVMVGDSSADVQAARGAKVAVMVTSFGYTSQTPMDLGADAVIDSLAEVPDVARALLLGLPVSGGAAIGSPLLAADA